MKRKRIILLTSILIFTSNVLTTNIFAQEIIQDQSKVNKEISKETSKGFICCNVQETDLAGHSENIDRYGEKLILADKFIGELINTLNGDDILIVMADHGNNPTIGHSKHTREMVPIMVTGPKVNKWINLGERETLSDIGATVAEYFGVHSPENGSSFLKEFI